MPINTKPKAPIENQAAQFEQDVMKVLESHGLTSTAELDEKTQSQLAAMAKDIATLADQVNRQSATQRFASLSREISSGRHKWTLGSREHAASAGRIFVAAILRDEAKLAAAHKAAVESGLWAPDIAAISPVTGVTGGYLVIEAMYDQIIRNVEEYGAMEREALIWPMGSNGGKVIKRTSGASVYHPDYAEAATASTPNFSRVRLEAKKYRVRVDLDNDMLEDRLVANIGEFIAQEIALAIAEATDNYAANGTGVESYARTRGVLFLAGGADVTADSGDDTFAEFIAASVKYLGKLAGGLPTYAAGNAKYMMSRSVLFGYLAARDTAGAPIAHLFVTPSGPQYMILGLPVVVNQKFPALSATAVSTPFIACGDWRKAVVIGRAAELKILLSEHVRILEDQVVLLGDLRQDIAVLDSSCYGRGITAAS